MGRGRNASVFGAAGAVRVSERMDRLKEIADRASQPAIRAIEPQEIEHQRPVDRALLEGAALTEGEMFAMMNMSADHRQQAIWHYGRQNIFEVPPFTLGTFADLRERGFAEKPEGSRYHRLTTNASALAAVIADELVRRHKIHAPVLVHAKGNFSKQVTFRCTCKWSCSISTWNLQANASRAFTSHLRSINAVAALEQAISIAPRQHSGQTEEG